MIPSPLQTWRATESLTAKEAGELFDITESNWWRIEQGLQRPSDDLEDKIVRRTGVSRDQMAILRKRVSKQQA